MASPYIARIKITRYVVDVPDKDKPGKTKVKRATKAATGARKVLDETPEYHLFDERGQRVKKLFRDKRASEAAMVAYITARERGESGLTDEAAAHRDRKAADLAEEYLAVFLAAL
jgi:hypothetical protein